MCWGERIKAYSRGSWTGRAAPPAVASRSTARRLTESYGALLPRICATRVYSRVPNGWKSNTTDWGAEDEGLYQYPTGSLERVSQSAAFGPARGPASAPGAVLSGAGGTIRGRPSGTWLISQSFANLAKVW